MAKPPEDEQPDETQEPSDEAPAAAEVRDGMSELEIRDAGVMIDLPYESPSGSPEPMQYEDLGDEKSWSPPEGFTLAGVPYDEVVAGIGGGARSTPPAPEDEGVE